MKKLFVVLVTLLATFLLVTADALAAKPEKAQGYHEKVTGDFTAYVGSASLSMRLDAHNTEPLRGNVTYSNSSGGHFSGVVDICYKQIDNKAVFAGTITEGTYQHTYFIVDVVDNGEGDKATGPDAVRVRTDNISPDCSEISSGFPGIVGEGNIKVHGAVEETATAATLSSEETGTCSTITSGLIKDSSGEAISTGFDKWGYNYQAHLFNGGYCDAYRNAEWCQPYKDAQLVMKWNDAWLSNKDCDGDGKLDRHYGYDSYIGSGAWETNHQFGEYTIEDGKACSWSYFVKIVAVPSNAKLVGEIWLTSDGVEIGSSTWGEFAIVQEVYNDTCGGSHGISYKNEAPNGFGYYMP